MSDNRLQEPARDSSIWKKITGVRAGIIAAIAALATLVGNIDKICTFAQKHGINVCGEGNDHPLNSLESISKYIKG